MNVRVLHIPLTMLQEEKWAVYAEEPGRWGVRICWLESKAEAADVALGVEELIKQLRITWKDGAE